MLVCRKAKNWLIGMLLVLLLLELGIFLWVKTGSLSILAPTSRRRGGRVFPLVRDIRLGDSRGRVGAAAPAAGEHHAGRPADRRGTGDQRLHLGPGGGRVALSLAGVHRRAKSRDRRFQHPRRCTPGTRFGSTQPRPPIPTTASRSPSSSGRDSWHFPSSASSCCCWYSRAAGADCGWRWAKPSRRKSPLNEQLPTPGASDVTLPREPRRRAWACWTSAAHRIRMPTPAESSPQANERLSLPA